MLIKNAKKVHFAIENEWCQFIYEGDNEYKEINSYYKDLENINPDKLIELALEMEKECKVIRDKVVNFSACGIGYSNSNYGIINSKGLNLKNKANLLVHM